MHFILFDTILEKHTVESLARAMKKNGHRVTCTGAVWHGHLVPTDSKDLQLIQRHVDQACSMRPDALLNFRAATLTPDMVRQLRKAGVFTMVWLPDDPVLYNICYKHIVDPYDLMLHCGGEQVLEFYQIRHGKSGVNFPFWTDEHAVPYSFNIDQAETDLVFLGNCIGPVRKNRYDFIANLPYQTKILGNVSEDPFKICAGYLEDTKAVAKELGNSLCGINIPQYFKDYKNTEYDFAGLTEMGHFQFPSRVIQYAAAGLPIISLEPEKPSDILFPELLRVSDRINLLSAAQSLFSDKQRLENLSQRTHQRFLTSFSAIARTLLLEQLVADPVETSKMPIAEKAILFSSSTKEHIFPEKTYHSKTKKKDFQTIPLQSIELPSINQQRHKLREKKFESQYKWRILHIGTFINGETDIVASLYRSLRILGHTVVHIDFRKHRNIIRNFPSKIDGNGPVYIDYNAILPWIDRLKPQIIICNAGGLCFTQSDADILKAQGILLLGITLSDPDVQPTVMSYANIFDYHTTNSLEALKQYHQAGIHNTLLLPFGIDRSFILSDCDDDKSLQADVICLGHAINRPERQSLMAQLAQQFQVRVYGRGWDLPKAFLVKGSKLLQASRGGRVHINFPRTLAGYANVKCGVFESIGSGAVLCTEKFTEMEHYFEYNREIVGFSNSSELRNKLKELFDSPVLMESIRRQGFKRLTNEHLYEHRWLDLFKKINIDINNHTEIVSKQRAEILAKTLRHTLGQQKKVIISGWYGVPNTGDELILKAIVEGVQRKNSNIQFTVAAENPVIVEKLHGLSAVSNTDVTAVDAELSDTCAVILGGGGLWHDYTFKQSKGAQSIFGNDSNALTKFAKIPLLAQMHGKPFDVFGIGVGPLTDLNAQHFLRFLGNNARSVSVRDSISYQLLTNIDGWNQPVSCFPDPVYSLDISKGSDLSFSELNEVTDQPYMLLNLRSWHSNNKHSLLEKTARVLENFALSNQCAIVGIAFQDGSSDYKVLERTFSMLDKRITRVLLKWSGEFNKIFSAIKNARAVVAMRLHCCLLAHRLNTPVIGISYDPKLLQHFRELNNEEYVLPLDFTIEDLSLLLKEAWEQQGSLSKVLRNKIIDIEHQSRKGITELTERLTHTKADYSLPVIEFKDQVQDLPVAQQNDTDFQEVALNLTEARITGGSTQQLGTDVPFVSHNLKEGIRFYINKSAPQKGDYVELQMQLNNLDLRGQLLCVSLKSPYSNKVYQERLCYNIFLDERLLLEEDVSSWAETNHIQILWRPTHSTSVLRIHTLAIKNCEAWTWGHAGRIIVKKIALHPCKYNGAMSVTYTSPFSTVMVS